MLGNASGRLGEAWGRLGECLGMLRGGLGRLGECLGMLRGSLGKAWECFVNASGKLGEAWGGLGNAWECFWGGLERLASLWASASQPKGCFWSTFLHFYAPASQPVASQACSIHGRPSGYIARPGHQASFKKRLPNMSVADKTGHFLAWGDQEAFCRPFFGNWVPSKNWLPNM